MSKSFSILRVFYKDPSLDEVIQKICNPGVLGNTGLPIYHIEDMIPGNFFSTIGYKVSKDLKSDLKDLKSVLEAYGDSVSIDRKKMASGRDFITVYVRESLV